jgi:hypothetical protein
MICPKQTVLTIAAVALSCLLADSGSVFVPRVRANQNLNAKTEIAALN